MTVSVARIIALSAAVALVAPLCACSGGASDLKSALGLDRQAPDEFGVVSRAPLSMPPDYTLRPPRAGALRPQETTPTEVARNTVFRTPVDNKETPDPAIPQGSRSNGEVAFLKQAGAGGADPNIRKILSQENSRLLESDRTFVDRLVFWRKPEEPGVVVDPVKEAQRLHANDAEGKPVTEGETPIIERKQKGFLAGVFNFF
jgi:hypothetical protein